MMQFRQLAVKALKPGARVIHVEAKIESLGYKLPTVTAPKVTRVHLFVT